MSGLKVNEEKTNIVYIGSLANQMPNSHITQKKLKWVEDGKFSVLGVDFSMQLVEMEELNYDIVMETVSNLIHHSSKRNLTVLGGNTVVKSLLIPKFNHLILFPPDSFKNFCENAYKR